MTPLPPYSAHLRVVSYNVHGLYLASRHRARRMAAIGGLLRELRPDVVALQEAFVERDRRALLRGLEGGELVHHAYYRSGLVGSGLMVLAAAPIEARDFRPFHARGQWWKPWQGDWYAGKGVALARVAFPRGPVQVFDTHAIAGYGPLSGENHGERCAQMVELADFVRARSEPEVPALVAGDLNARPDDAPYRIARRLGRLRRLSDSDGEIDHVLAVASPRHGFEALETRRVSETTLVGAQRVPLSDHPAVVVDLRVEARPVAAEAGRLLAAG